MSIQKTKKASAKKSPIRHKTIRQPPFAPAASFVAKYLYRPLRRLLNGMDTNATYGRLRGALLKVMADKEGRSGRIDLLSGKLKLLEGFEFNNNNLVRQPFLKKCRSWVHENKTHGLVELPSINPSKDLIAPAGAAYFKLFVFMIGISHKTECYHVKINEWMGFHNIKQRINCRQCWSTQKKLEGPALLITGFGIRFYNDKMESLERNWWDTSGATHSLVIHKALLW